MLKGSSFLYPVTKETIHKYAKSIFDPVRSGECVTTVWVPMSGRRKHNRFVIENIELFEKELPHHDKYLLVYIEPLDLTEEGLSGYLRLMAKSFIEVCEKNPEAKNKLDEKKIVVFDDQTASYSRLLDGLRGLLLTATQTGLEVVFFVGEFDELEFANKVFYNNLKSLWSQLYPKLHYVFLMRERVTRQDNIKKWGELNEAILQNIVYVPVLEESDIGYMFQRLSYESSRNISKESQEILKRLCGGHPYMLKVAFRVLSAADGDEMYLEDLLLEHHELRSVAAGILEVLGQEEKAALERIAKGGKASEIDRPILEFIEKMGYVSDNMKDGYRLFGKLFETAALGYSEREKTLEDSNGDLKLDEESGAILLSGKTVEEKFTRQEYSILNMFLKNDKLYSRDDIGAVLWGKDSYERYSDWAIDQLISKLRKKLLSLGTKDKVVTVRGKGYKLLRSAS